MTGNVLAANPQRGDVGENRRPVSRIHRPQRRVEGHNFDIRRHVVRYDDVMNQHRGIIYTRRQKILVKLAEGDEADTEEVSPLHQDALDAMQREVEAVAQLHGNDVDTEKWNMEEIKETILKNARTGYKGDGIIAVAPVEDAINIRTGNHKKP